MIATPTPTPERHDDAVPAGRVAGRVRGILTGPSLPGIALLGGVLLVIAVYGWTSGSPSTQLKIAAMFVSVIFVVALQIFSGNSGILSFGHMAFAAIGAYVSSILTLDPLVKAQLTGLPAWLRAAQLDVLPAAGVAILVAGAVALPVGILVLRLNGASTVIAIFALLLMCNVILNGWSTVTQGPGGLYAVPRATTIGLSLAFAVVAIAVARFYRDSAVGLQLRATRDDPLSAGSVGVRVHRTRLSAWVISAMVSASGGVLLAHLLTAFTPSTFYLSQTFHVVVMLVVGGIDTVSGAVLGTVIVTVVQEVLRPLEDASVSIGALEVDRLTGLTQAAYVLMILGVMYFRPDGLLGHSEAEVSLKRVASRRMRSRTQNADHADRPADSPSVEDS
jgi:branched-chain amino acid transport system permease protein